MNIKNNTAIIRFTLLLITQVLLIFSLKAQLQIGDDYTIEGTSGPVPLNQTRQYYVDFSTPGPAPNPSWAVWGGTITGTWTSGQRYYASVYWNTVSSANSITFRSNTNVTEDSKSVTVVPVASISGSTSVHEGQQVTYSHTGTLSSGAQATRYNWVVSGGTIVAENSSARTVTVRWTSEGSRSLTLEYDIGFRTPDYYTLTTRNVTVGPPEFTGTYTLVHGTTTTYTHTGQQTLSGYDWVVEGGTEISENDGAKQVTVRWDPTNGNTRRLRLYYNGSLKRTKTITVNMPFISGASSGSINDTHTFTHNAATGSGYYWSADRGTVTGTNTGAKQGTIRWTDNGTNVVRLYYSGYQLATKNVSVADITISGINNTVHGSTITYSHNGGGSGSSYGFNVNGGSVISRNDAAKEVRIRWTTLGLRSFDVTYAGSAPQKSMNVTVTAPTITGAFISALNGEVTYTHGGYSSSNYTWTTSAGGTVTGFNDGARTATVKWNNNGSQTVNLYYSGAFLRSYNVTVNELVLSGEASAGHGEEVTYTHDGAGTLTNYTYDITGGTMVTEDPANKQVTVRWTGTGSIDVRYDGTLQETKNVTVDPLLITGPDESVLDQSVVTYTHDGSGIPEDYQWEAVNGTVLSENPVNKTAIVRWDADPGTLNLKYRGATAQTKAVTGFEPLFIQATKGTNLQSNPNLTLETLATYSGYQWYRDDVLISGSGSSIDVTTVGEYYAKHTTAGGLEITSNAVKIIDEMFWAQEKNMIVTYDIRKEGMDPLGYDSYTLDDAYTTVTYVDGLNRPLQTIAKGQSFDARDIIQPYQFDVKGRTAKGFLPYVADQNTGFYRDLALENNLRLRLYSQSEQQLYYANSTDVTNDSAPYAESVYEDNPRGRVLEQGGIGADWQPGTGHTARYAYRFNTADPADRVRKWKEDGTTNGDYAANTLRVVEMTDENDHLVLTYTNMRGQIILKKVQSGAGDWLETYNIYDRMGRMKFTIPPQAVEELGTGSTLTLSAAFIDDWVNAYTYDSRGRLVEKKVPGAAPEFYIYDERDRLILSQNGKLRENNQWSFSKIDDRDRVVYSGLYTDNTNTTRAAMQAVVDALDYDVNAYYETPAAIATYHGYTNSSFPTTNLELHAVVYYDTYDYDRNGNDDVTYDAAHYPGTEPENYPARIGQVTGGKTRVLGTTTWLQSSTFYDEWGRAIQTVSDHHLGGTDKVSMVIDDKGQVVRTKATHTKGTDVRDEFRQFDYHANGSLEKMYHALDDEVNNKKLISSLNYSPLGELKEKNLFSEDNGSTFLQSVDYSYNIRGWLTAINDAALSQETDDLFGMELTYNTAASGLTNTNYYNGNISAIKWSAHNEQGNDFEKAYTYDYDHSDRLTGANPYTNTSVWASSNEFDVSNLTYDKNGNILSLNRTDTSGVNVDQLTYTYQANQLTEVVDNSNSDNVFKDDGTSGDDYTYDGSGNMTQDKNKGIQSITYNHLNLPATLVFESTEWLDSLVYTYTAGGQKLKVEMWRNNAVVKATDYAGSYHYENDALQYIHYEEGQIMMNDTETDYRVYLRDHQGNTRRVVSALDNIYTSVEDFEDTESMFADLRLHTSSSDNATLPLESNDGVSLLTSGQTGALGVLRVNKGDVIDLSVIARYNSNPSGNTFAEIAFGTLATSFGGPLSTAAEETVTGTETAFSDALGAGLAGRDGSSTTPRAFLNYILFDQDMGYKNAGFQQIQAAASTNDTLRINDIAVDEMGFLLVYLSNENQEAVSMYFDELTIVHEKTKLVQATDYYPFGGIATTHTRMSSDPAKYLYNAGAELNDSTGYYETFYRNYDATIGRFHSIDPVAAKYASLTPYNYAFNDPVLVNDPLGDDAGNGVFVSDDYVDPIAHTRSFWSFFSNLIKARRARTEWKQKQYRYDPDQDSDGANEDEKSEDEKSEEDEKTGFVNYECPEGTRCETDKDGNIFVYNDDGTIREVLPKPTDQEKAFDDIAQFGDLLSEVGKEAAINTLIFYGGGVAVLRLANGAIAVVKASRLVKMAETGKLGFKVNPGKFKYFFGKVTSGRSHNVSRSAQNLKDLTELGIESKSQLVSVFQGALRSGTTISTKTNTYGRTVVRAIEIENKGSIHVSFLYRTGSKTPEVTTIIPKIFKR